MDELGSGPAAEAALEKVEGWAFVANSRKAHYMVGSMALCRKYGFYFGPLEPAGKPSPDDCVQCSRLLAQRQSVGVEGREHG